MSCASAPSPRARDAAYFAVLRPAGRLAPPMECTARVEARPVAANGGPWRLELQNPKRVRIIFEFFPVKGIMIGIRPLWIFDKQVTSNGRHETTLVAVTCH
jgi:hypothetical protein